MSPIPSKKLLLVSLLSTFIVGGTSKPSASPDSHNLLPREDLNILKTTSTEHHIIDWIPIGSQGKIAQAPPPLAPRPLDPTKNASLATTELNQPGAQLGPPGTVPIPRRNVTSTKKSLPPTKNSKEKSKRQYANDHWYVYSYDYVTNIGGGASNSLYNACVAPNDFSLLQTAVTVYDSCKGEQTVEAGWINYPDQETPPHLFTYFTTDDYAGNANGVGGWNREVTGWIQYSSTVFPGTVFTPLSKIGGAQYEMQFEYLLYEGNWWLWVVTQAGGGWIGYYPGSLFSTACPTGPSLATGSNLIYFYGEVYQSEGPLTNTDMGSGEFGTTEWPNSAYFHNMFYITPGGTVGTDVPWTSPFYDSDSTRYNHVFTLPTQGNPSGAYAFIGGPGANHVLC